MAITYKSVGVDTHKKANMIQALAEYLKDRPRDPRLLSGVGPFASCYSLKEIIHEFDDPILATCCDGVGTKVRLALDWNDLTGIGQDLVAMNVNDLLCVGARPYLFLDYFASSQIREEFFFILIKSIQGACEMAECTLAGGETAELPGLYQDRDFDLAGFCLGFADRSKLLGPERVRENDRIILIPSSGIHSNGYSLVRKLVEKEKLLPQTNVPWGGMTWKECLLRPTMIYVSALKDHLAHVHAAAHITGGGLFENLLRVVPQGLRARIDSSRWKIPALFGWIQEKASLSVEQLLSTFNCGAGMLVMSPENYARELTESLAKKGFQATDVGVIETTSDTTRVVWE